MEKGEQHAQGVKQTLETMIGTDLSLKHKKKSEYDLNKELFEKVIIALERTNIRTALVGTEFEIDLSKYEKKIFSQNGEDGVTMKLIELLYDKDSTDNKYYVEFSVHTGKECNTRILREEYNWKGLLMDGSNENIDINLRKEFITKDNIIDLFKKYNVPSNINLLSVDIDFNDYYVLNEILNNYTCDIIICEYNATHLPAEDKIVIYDKNARWNGTNYFGASLLALDKLSVKFNYSLVYCDNNGVNCYFIKNSILKDKNLQFLNNGDIKKIYRKPTYGRGPNGGHREDNDNRKYVSSHSVTDCKV
jgi:hypothetical protein